MPGERGVMFIGCDQQTPGADLGAVDHHIFGWDSDLGQLRGGTSCPFCFVLLEPPLLSSKLDHENLKKAPEVRN